MKKKLLPLLLMTASLSLSGCSFFDFIHVNDISTSPWEGSKQELTYTQKDLTPIHYYDNMVTMPTTGKPKLLVLPIAFSDTSDFLNEEQKATVIERLNKAVFGSEEDTGWHSVSSYYKTESFGACEIEGEVASWYQTTYSYNNVNTDVTKTVLNNAINDWKYHNPEKISEYDTDADGYIDGILAIYGGPNYGNIKPYPGHHPENTNMWAYTSWLTNDPNISNPNGGAFIWASFDFMDVDNSEGLSIDAHTYIHEMGHVFGLDDYYDYAHKGEWAGSYSMQDYNVGGHDPYSLMSLGWAKPYVPTYSTSITIKPFESSGDVILISPDFSSNSAYDEYLLVELYSPTGTNERDSKHQYGSSYPIGPSKVGIRLWHVDARLLKITKSQRQSKTVEYYNIVNTIDPTEGKYIVGCSNTTYVEGQKETNEYCSLASELRDYKLLELIRRNDYKAGQVKNAVSNDDLFKAGDSFSASQYTGYFGNGRLNNGSRINWTIRVDALSNDEATITVLK